MTVAVREVVLRNYKSIAHAHVTLEPLTLMVGPNGSGKSNFIDALRLTSDALSSTLDHAIRQRGGINEVRRRSSGHPTNFSLQLHLNLRNIGTATFAFEIGAQPNGGFRVVREKAKIARNDLSRSVSFYNVKDGALVDRSEDLPVFPSIVGDRFFLTSVSGLTSFRPLYDHLTGMLFYSINPDEIRVPQAHDAGETLVRSGKNLASVLRRLEKGDRAALERIEEYVRHIVPGVEGFESRMLGPTETIEFRQTVSNNKHAWRFYASAMSDGTLRSVGNLVALFQPGSNGELPTLVGIEEPESTIHPGAAAVVVDALIESSKRRQVIATTHSPELLDSEAIEIDSIRVVRNVAGETTISRCDRSSRRMVRERLFTAGELMRSGQIEPDTTEPSVDSQMLFAF